MPSQAASDVYSPISGEVVEINSALVDDPSKVSTALGNAMPPGRGRQGRVRQLGQCPREKEAI